MKVKTVVVLLLMLIGAGWAKADSRRELMTRLDSLDKLPPNRRYYEMLKEPTFKDMVKPQIESSGCRLVGKWGRGCSWRVTGKGSLVFLSLGSECAIVNFADSAHPQILAEVQARGEVANSFVNDSILFIGGQGIDLWDVRNPATPAFLSRIEVTVSDIFARDTLLYSVCSDSFRVFSLADPRNPVQIGASNDTGYSMSIARNYAFLPAQWDMGIVDISDPTHPHRVGGFGDRTTAVFARDTLAYVTTLDNGFKILNVRNPLSIVELGGIPSLSDRPDICVTSYFAYLPDFAIIDVSDPSNPAIVGQCGTNGGHRGVWVGNPWTRAFVAADWEGLQSISIGDPTHPRRDTALLPADGALDVKVVGDLAVVAEDRAGLHLLDVSSPVSPTEVGVYDTVGSRPWFEAVAVADSYAFTGEWDLRSVSLADPTHPWLAGTCPIFNEAQSMVIRGAYLYVAEDYRFEVFDISQPRNPRLLGSSALHTGGGGICLQDSFAFVAPELCIINVARPTTPQVIYCDTWYDNCAMSARDTFIYSSHAYDSLCVFSVADPRQPRELGWSPVNGLGCDVVVSGSRAYVGCNDLCVFDISDPAHPTLIGYYTTPYRVRRVYCAEPYIYAACYGAGVCILETTTTTGVAESRPTGALKDNNRFRVAAFPNPAQNEVELQITPCEAKAVTVKIADVTGRKLIEVRLPVAAGKAHLALPRGLMPAGVYFLTATCGTAATTVKAIKR